jgi:preprotein translocase subunit YajC
MWSILDATPSMLLLAQDPAPAQESPLGPLAGLLPFILIGVLFYFMLIRPERRKRAEMTDLLSTLKKNDRIVTIGGIYGVVVNVQKESEDVTIRVDDSNNTRLRVLRSAISRVVNGDDSDKSDSK